MTLHSTQEVVFTTNQTESLLQASMTEQGKMVLVLFEDSPVQHNHRQKALELCLFWSVSTGLSTMPETCEDEHGGYSRPSSERHWV